MGLRPPRTLAIVTATIFRLLVAAWILITLARAARAAWSQRALLTTVWGAIRPRHVLGAVAGLAVVATVVLALLTFVPVTGYGLGSLIGVDGNAVFIPLDEAASRAPAGAPGGHDWTLIGLTTIFLGGLAVLLPWLAFVEEEVFRAGLEDATLGRQLRSALVFGLAHLVMLVPLAATLGIAVAGFGYGRAYRRGHAAAAAPPPAVAAAFRPTKRSRAAAARARVGAGSAAAIAGGSGGMLLVAPSTDVPEVRQAAGVLASTVWHTTFNTLVIVLVWLSIVIEAW